jgi:DNA-binding NtrC family response regulator
MQVRFNNTTPVAPLSSHTAVEYGSPLVHDTLIGVSRWADTARMLLRIHAAHDNAIILEGEPGTGKQLLARLIHRSSARRDGPFVVLSVHSNADDVARDALFGSRKPSKAGEEEKGLAELAHGGTLYIDGLSEVSHALTGDIVQLADRRSHFDEAEPPVRVMLGFTIQPGSYGPRSASAEASRGLDYERIRIPPLRERPDDIELLAQYFLQELCQQIGKEPRSISPEAMVALRAYDWPRNVSELRALMRQLVKQSNPPSIDVPLLPAYMAGSVENAFIPAAGLDLEDEVRRVEVDLIRAALRQSHGYQNKAAQLLHLKPTTLFMKIRRYGIDVEVFRRAS